MAEHPISATQEEPEEIFTGAATESGVEHGHTCIECGSEYERGIFVNDLATHDHTAVECDACWSATSDYMRAFYPRLTWTRRES